MIHLSSYEDRDRGPAPASNTPRMLYDPTTGGMVAVKDNNNNKKSSSSGGSKRRQNKSRRGGGGGGEPQANTSTRANGSKGGNKAAASDKPKRERGGRNRKEGGRGGNNAKSQSTRRSRKGGGRKVDNEGTYGNVALYTGFDAGQPQLGMQTTMTEEPTPTFEVVKADDKMELLADANDSPTLKPTAKEFAPSQAALAAAAARAANGGSSVSSDEERDEDGGDDVFDGDEDEDNDGLGFDPTQDMDGLMMSGHHDDDDSDAALDFDALNLTDPISFPNKDGDDEPRHIFAFGSSGTWGGAGNNNKSDWDSVPSATTAATSGGLFGSSDNFLGSSSDEKASDGHVPFLNIPAGSSWGAFGSGIVNNNPKTGD